MEMSFVLFAGSLPALRSVRPAQTLAILRRWRRRAYERRLLTRFGEREMRDLALTPADIRREIAKPFWRG
jgi:uncharacterized protein YjiS (DUF1127 family)